MGNSHNTPKEPKVFEEPAADPAMANVIFKGYKALRSMSINALSSDVYISNTIATELGSGAFGEVFLVKAEDNTLYAIKRIACNSPADATKGLTEANLLASVAHEAIVTCKAVFSQEGKPKSYICIVMEYIEGRTLEELKELPLDVPVCQYNIPFLANTAITGTMESTWSIG